MGDESVPMIDDEGNLFGVINVIDALVVLFVIAIVVAGIAVVSSSGDETSTASDTDLETRYVTVDFGTQPDYRMDRIRDGEPIQLDENELTVSDTYAVPTADPDDRNVHLLVRGAVEGEVTDSETGSSQFAVGGNQLRVGDSREFTANGHTLSGEITKVDTTDVPIQTERIRLEVTLEDVRPATATSVRTNMTETFRGETIATVEAVDRQSATIVSEDGEGTLFVQSHPQNQDLRLQVELLTRETDSGMQFRGSVLREGNEIALDLGTTTVRGTVTSLRV